MNLKQLLVGGVLSIALLASCSPHHNNTTASATQKSVSTTSQSTEMPGFKEISYNEIPGNMINLIKNDMLITAGTKDNFNMMTANWGGFGFLWVKPVSFIFVKNVRYTYEFLEKNDGYTLTFFSPQYKAVFRLMGKVSGRDFNKTEHSGLTPLVTPSGQVGFKEASMIIECKKLYDEPMNADYLVGEAKNTIGKSLNKGESLNSMFIGQITKVWIKNN